MAQKKPSSEQPPRTFESALERIEQIAAQMETGNLPLEDLVTAYEEGLGLIHFCSGRLEEAEKRLETISRNASGQPIGIEPAENTGQNPGSTPDKSSGSQQDSSGSEAASGSVRLF